MDIDVTSTSGDTLSSFGVELQIVPLPGATSFLQFTSSSSDPYSNGNYVFFGVSGNSDYGIPFWSLPTITNYPSDTIFGGDSDEGTGAGYVTIGSSVGALNTFVATVQFQAPAGATPGDQFQIMLVNDPSFSYFNDQNGNPLAIDNVSGGLVTIAVPEPSTITLFAVSSLVLAAYGRRLPGSCRPVIVRGLVRRRLRRGPSSPRRGI